MTPEHYKQVNLINFNFLANVNVDIKDIDIQQCFTDRNSFLALHVADEEWGENEKKTGSRKSVKRK